MTLWKLISALFKPSSPKTMKNTAMHLPELCVEVAKEDLRAHEGLRLEPYTDTTGHKSIAYGRNLDDNPYPKEVTEYLAHLRSKGIISGEGITIAVAEYLLSIGAGS